MAFCVFLWKNLKYLQFHWLRTIVIFAGCLVLLAVVMGSTFRDSKQPRFVPDSINEESFNSHLSCEPDDFIAYAPSTPWINDLMESVRQELQIVYTRWKSFDTKQDMMLFLDDHKNTKSFLIFFDQFPDDTSSVNGTNLSYFISAQHTKPYNNRIFYNDDDVVGMQIFDDYVSSGYFALQNAIDRKYIETRTDKKSYPIEVARFPQIELMDIDSTRVHFFGIVFIVFFYIIILTTFIVPLVEEKQDGMQAYLTLTTSRSYLNCLTFYIIQFVIYSIFICLSIIIVRKYNGMGSVSWLPFLTLLLLFVLSTMNYALLISVFLKSVYLAKIGGFLAICVPTVLFTIKESIFENCVWLMSGNMFLEGLSVFQIFTNKRRDFTFSDINVRITKDSYTLLEVYVILILQFFVYIVLYECLSNVFPAFGGVRKPFYSIFKSFCKNKRPKYVSEVNLNADIPVRIVNLVKNFSGIGKKSKKAVNNLSMDVDKDKITVLLGHNGAGKTTTINMIIGSIEKSSGHIRVCGETDIEAYRNSIGYCPQHNIFMQYMTCQEHLELFSRLRGHTRAEAKSDAEILLKELMLADKANVVGESLSGGMKRRLALAMAISGKTPIAVLDEPTSGLDPESRRILWDILLKLRKTRTILITTHYMEEAEVLGDVIAIMSQGELVCKGSSMELKRERGSGYVLKLLLHDDFEEIDMDKVMNVIQSHVPNAEIYSTVRPTYCVTLPYSYRKFYPKLMEELNEKKQHLRIAYFSVANSSLEDVFLNCTGSDEADNGSPEKRIPYKQLKNGISLIASFKVLGICYKKLLYMKSKWLYTLIMFLFPLITIGIAFWIMNVGVSSYATDIPIKLNIHIPGSEILMKIASEYSDFEHYLDTEIQSMNALPVHVPQHESLEETLLSIQEKDITRYYERIFGAIELRNNEKGLPPTVKILYSGNVLHSSVSLLNLIDNVMLKFNARENFTIHTHNAQIPKSIVVSPARLEYFSSIVPIGCFFYMLFYVSLPFREIRTQFKKLQNISRFTYWASHTIFDIFLHIIFCLIMYAFIYVFNTKQFFTNEEIFKIQLAIALYGLAYLPLLYLLAISSRSISTISTYLFLFLMIATIMPIITSANAKAIETNMFLICIFMMLPDFALKHQLMVINENYFISRRNDLKATSNGKTDQLLGENMFYIYMIGLFVLLESFLVFVWDNLYNRESIQRYSLGKLCKSSSPVDQVANNEDLDTVDSSSSLENKDYSLKVDNLNKIYGSGAVHAVRGINFNVQDGECFGLLGLNGAGKSTTFEMITGNETISRGSVSIKGVHIKTNEFNTMYGYCPQVDALNGFMTSKQILRYMAFLRGIPWKDISREVNYWLKELDLYNYRNIPIKHYSGGTKRKLNTALAMIADPCVIFLDEPTTGVDPKSRRFMWKCIQEFQRNQKTIVLTSHSMDECEHLCNRLAIMSQGQIKCIDYIPKLKEKYGDKFTITIKLQPECTHSDIIQLKFKMDQYFQCTEREQHDLTIVYLVKALPWSKVFANMECIMDENSNIIDDYAVSETTLEDIFLGMKNV